jgi:hypothetical protein
MTDNTLIAVAPWALLLSAIYSAVWRADVVPVFMIVRICQRDDLSPYDKCILVFAFLFLSLPAALYYIWTEDDEIFSRLLFWMGITAALSIALAVTADLLLLKHSEQAAFQAKTDDAAPTWRLPATP